MRIGKTILLAMALCALMTVVASAASIDGTWIVKTPGRDGATTDTTYIFKTDGMKLGGTITTARGERAIKEGKVDGDNFEFSVEQPARGDNPATVRVYKGKVSGDSIAFSTMMGDREIKMTGDRKK